jgi:hypothetical protein
MSYGLLALGDASSSQSTLSVVATRIVVDRSYSHGGPTLELRRCVALNSANTAIIDSHLGDCHQHGNDSQAIAGWNGPGPFKIENNYMEAGHEVLVLGGADPYIAGLIPSDVEVRRNHITRPMSWQGKWDIKNLIEFKAGQRVLLEANVIENNWVSAQNGFSILFWNAHSAAGSPGSTTRDITFRYNLVRNVAGGFNIKDHNDPAAIGASRMTIAHNVITGLGGSALGGNGRLYQILGNVTDLHIEHNTGFGVVHDVLVGELSGRRLERFTFANNLTGGEYTLFMNSMQGSAAIASALDANSKVTANVFAGSSAGNVPTGNWFASSRAAIGFVSESTGDVHLTSTSAYRTSATDGTAVGANVDAVLSAVSGVVR